MLSFANLNEGLTAVLATGTVDDAERLVASTLLADSVFTALTQAKRFDLLGTFLPLLDLDRRPELYESIDRLFAEAIVEGNQEDAKQIKLHLGKYLNDVSVSFHVGTLMTSAVTLGEHEDYTAYTQYKEGLVSVDNLDLLLTLRNGQIETSELRQAAGRYCAKRVMNHFGYSKPLVGQYIRGAFERENIDTITYLFEKVKKKEVVLKLVKNQIFFYSGWTPTFACELVANGYVSFTKDEWRRIKSEYSSFYRYVSADV